MTSLRLSTKNGFMQTVHVILLPAETLGAKLNHAESLQEAIYQAQQSRQEARDRELSAEAKYDGQSLQEAKISGLI